VPEYTQAEQIKALADEVFDVSADAWRAQSRDRGKLGIELSETEFLALDILAKADGPLTVGQIQREIGILAAQMSRVIRSLETKADRPLVRCSINLSDKRKVDVELSEEGREAHHAYRELKLGTMQRVLEELSKEDRNEFMRILRKMREIMLNSLSRKEIRNKQDVSLKK
jgi:DNA-binding MarR family transcriptional regulator